MSLFCMPWNRKWRDISQCWKLSFLVQDHADVKCMYWISSRLQSCQCTSPSTSNFEHYTNIINLVTFQCMAASDMARPNFVMTEITFWFCCASLLSLPSKHILPTICSMFNADGYCDHLPRMIAFFDTKVPEDIHEDIREGALTVVEFLCRVRQCKRQLQPVYSSDSNYKLFLSIWKARDARIVWLILKKEVIDCIEIGTRHGRESSKLVSLWFMTTYARAVNEQFQTFTSCF